MIRFDVLGVPIPKGSMRAFMLPGKKYPTLVSDNRRTKPWQKEIYKAALTARCPKLYGAVVIVVEFHMPRPKGHFGKRGLLPSAPLDHVVKPDVDKLERALLDGLKGLAFLDDAQVTGVFAVKRYAGADEVPGAVVAVGPLKDADLRALVVSVLAQISDPEKHRRLTAGETASLFGDLAPDTTEEAKRG